MHLMHLRQRGRGHDFVLPNIKYDFNKRGCWSSCRFQPHDDTLLLVHFFIMSKFYAFVLCVLYVDVLYELFFSSIMLCACFLCKHLRLSCAFYNKLTYLQGWLGSRVVSVPGSNRSRDAVG